MEEPGWFGQFQFAEDVVVCVAQFGALRDVAGVAGELSDVQCCQVFADPSPATGGVGGLGDADE